MLYHLISICIILQLASCNSNNKSKAVEGTTTVTAQTGKVGGPCDTCELMYVDMPATINAVDTSIAWNGKGQKLVITGTVFKPDKKTPAPNIIIYYWQTNEQGVYANHPNLNPKAKRHGYIRGWLKTDSEGKYTIYTIKPASYPNTQLPAHIHLLIKEPHIGNEYYIDDIEFEDDPLLTKEVRKQRPNRAGNGIVSVHTKDGIMSVTRDIILGLNLENYPN